MLALASTRRSRPLLAAFALAVAPLAALADIHIGVTLSTTGPGASLGIPAEQALKLWPASWPARRSASRSSTTAPTPPRRRRTRSA
jgi:hypothetical protein